jgi:adenylate cyclase
MFESAGSESLSSAYFEVSGPAGERTLSLQDGNTWRIGRHEQSDLVLVDDLVSRKHAIVQRTEHGDYYLIDLGSRNGSYLNGARVTVPRILNHGDVVAIGESLMKFHHQSQADKNQVEELLRTSGETRLLMTARLMTVLVVDVRGFTKLAQQIDQAMLCNLIATWFGHGERILREHGSWTQKFIGDALMAVWLHETAQSAREDILEVMAGCIEFAHRTNDLRAKFVLPEELRIGAGINTGVGSVGNTGRGEVADFTAMGDTVNAAFRIESSTKEIGLDLAIGRQSFDLLRAGANLDEYFQARSVMLKGYAKPMEVWGAPFELAERYLNQQRSL